ncbi:MAG TPA: sigma-70 family RNA polymerase sigma factor [Acidimicrobiales bacterium]|nr:sigma-70 family RNA polymerase sigma factor [Acidimicrobiales bacterium]
MGAEEEARFARLVHEHSAAVGNYLRRRLYPLSASDLDDLVEETMIVVWRRLDRVPQDAELPWMLGVARNVLRNARRSKTRRSAVQARLVATAHDASAEENVVADESVRHALNSLSEDDREILLLHAWDGLDTQALGTYFAISTNAAAVRLSRAQRRFREILNDKQVE